jgi:hypothetical protein
MCSRNSPNVTPCKIAYGRLVGARTGPTPGRDLADSRFATIELEEVGPRPAEDVASAGASPPNEALAEAIARYMTRFDQVNDDRTAVVSAENELEHGSAALLTVEGSGYRLFPLSNPQAVERTLGVLALARHEQEQLELINEVLAAIAYELSVHAELSLFTLATSV